MKKPLKITLYVLGLLLLAATGFFFYQTNTYYLGASIAWKVMLFHTFLMGAASVAIFFMGQKNQRIAFKWLFALVFISSMIIGTYQYVISDFSRVEGGTLAKEGTQLQVLQEDELTENKQIIFHEGELVRKTNYILDNLPDEFASSFKRAKFLESMANYALNVLITMFGGLIFYLVFASLGTALFYRKEKLSTQQHLLSFFLGAGVFSIGIFFLVVSSTYTFASFLVLLAAALLVSNKKILEKIKFLSSAHFSFKEKRKETLLVLGFFTVFLAMGTLDSIRPFPLAWDDNNLYARIAKLMASENVFPEGIGPTAWTNIQSITWLFTDVMQGTLVLHFAVLSIFFILFYHFTKNFLNKSSALWATVFISLVPMLIFFSAIDLKVEIPFFATGLAALMAWMQWIKTDKKRDLIVATFLLGFLLTIKITALLFVAILLLVTLYIKTRAPFLTLALYFGFLDYFALTGQTSTLKAFDLNPQSFAIVISILALICLAISLWKEKPWKKNPPNKIHFLDRFWAISHDAPLDGHACRGRWIHQLLNPNFW